MAVFWMLAALMTAVALAFVLVPLLRGRPPAGPSAVEANLEALRGQRRELEADIASGVVPASRERALAELARELSRPCGAFERHRPSSGLARGSRGVIVGFPASHSASTSP
jgi:cytochrome c-type biogenesis protein CcmI